jgi:hypothetical protein
MILISHRGNVSGIDVENENRPAYIERAIALGYDVEIDIFFVNDKLYLGHDEPQYNLSIDWLIKWKTKLWIHCKDLASLSWANQNINEFNYFFHDKDKATLTSKNIIWAFPGNQPLKNSVAVLPEIFNDNLSQCIGVCSDEIFKYK